MEDHECESQTAVHTLLLRLRFRLHLRVDPAHPLRVSGRLCRRGPPAVRDPDPAPEPADLRGSVEQGGGGVRASIERRPGFTL